MPLNKGKTTEFEFLWASKNYPIRKLWKDGDNLQSTYKKEAPTQGVPVIILFAIHHASRNLKSINEPNFASDLAERLSQLNNKLCMRDI